MMMPVKKKASVRKKKASKVKASKAAAGAAEKTDDKSAHVRKRVIPPHLWKKGQSGNPGGKRSKERQEVMRLVRGLEEGRGAEAIVEELWSIAVSHPDDHRWAGPRVTALRELADRCWGKPVAAMQVTGADGGPLNAQVVFYLPDNGMREAVE
jgi:hypothetical protein